MSALLSQIEAKGIRFEIAGEHLKVMAAENVLDDDVVVYLRAHKAELMAQYLLRVFVRLVQAFGVSHGLLLDHDVVLAELDDDDRRELMATTVEDRQAWAELLAYRLTRSTAR